mgnify:FL=1
MKFMRDKRSTSPTSWLLVTVSTRGSSTERVHVWRKLRSLGALYLQNSVAVLPDLPDTDRAVARLVDRVRRSGGQGRALRIQVLDAEEEQGVIAQFQAERSDEYAEIVSRVPAFLEEIAYERKRGRATYAEVEESEADLERLRKWFARVQKCDYFGAPGRAEAEQAISRCAEELAAFEREAIAAELPDEEAVSKTRAARLRIVNEG